MQINSHYITLHRLKNFNVNSLIHQSEINTTSKFIEIKTMPLQCTSNNLPVQVRQSASLVLIVSLLNVPAGQG